MLIQFSIKNYKSFKDEVVFSLNSSSIKEHSERNTFEVGKFHLLKSAVIYGANASGKTNLFHAIFFMKRFVKNSSKNMQVNEPIPYKPFLLSSETESKPSEFEIIFIHEKIRYRYGFAVDSNEVKAEWLFHTVKTRETPVFTRQSQKINLSKHTKKEKEIVSENLVRKNALFLSVSAQFNGEISTKVVNWFDKLKVLYANFDEIYEGFTREMASKENYKAVFTKLLKEADISIHSFDIKEFNLPVNEMPEPLRDFVNNNKSTINLTNYKVNFNRKKYDKNGKFIELTSLDMDSDESAGTRKFFNLLGPIIDTIQNGYVLFIDELDSRLHPKLVREILSLFNSKRNSKNAQIISTSHNTSVLEKNLLRRDQIWFVEKNRFEASNLFSLVEYIMEDNKKVRNDASYESDYLKGKYGAVPILKEFEVL